MRFGESARRLKRAVDDGELGELILVDGIEKAFRDPEYYARDRGGDARDGGCRLPGGASIHVNRPAAVGPPVGHRRERVRADRAPREAVECPTSRSRGFTGESGAPGMLESSTAILRETVARRGPRHERERDLQTSGTDHLYFWDVAGGGEAGPVRALVPVRGHAGSERIPRGAARLGPDRHPGGDRGRSRAGSCRASRR